MEKKPITITVVLVLILFLSSGRILQTNAAPLTQEDTRRKIDEQVWDEIKTSPLHETTFLVSLDAEGDLAIEAQFRLEKMLDYLQEGGVLSRYQSYYGANIIKITGELGVLHVLEDWPELAKVSVYEEDDPEYMGLENKDQTITSGTGQITGTVTIQDGITPIDGIKVTAYVQTGPASWGVADIVFTDASGAYNIASLAEGVYRAKFEDPSGDYIIEYYNDKPTWSLATNFNVTDGQISSNIDASLEIAGKISGNISLMAGGTEDGLVASAYTWSSASGSWVFYANAISNSNGDYAIVGLPPGNYRIRFSDSSVNYPARYVTEWYDNQLEVMDAQDVMVTAGVTTLNINASLGSYGGIQGNVKANDGLTNLENIYVDVYRFDGSWVWFAYDTTDASGNFEVFGLGTEQVRVGFTDTSGQFEPEYYNDQPDLASATNVSVELGYATTGIDAQLNPSATLVNKVFIPLVIN